MNLLAIGFGRPVAQSGLTRQEDIKATFLYNFAKFVEWPEDSFGDAASSFQIEVIGRDPFDGRLDRILLGKTIRDRPVQVIHSLGSPSPKSVQIAFVARSEVKRLDELLHFYGARHVLTVSDIPDFTRRGGMIGFVIVSEAVRFRIDQAAVQHCELRMSAQLLGLGLPPAADKQNLIR